MRPAIPIIILIQGLLTVGTVVMSRWSGMPGLGTLGFGLLGVSAMAAALPATRRAWVRNGCLASAWAATMMVPASAALAHGARVTVDGYFDSYYASVTWMVAAAILPTSHRLAGTAQQACWRLLVVAWAMLGGILWLITSYLRNQPGAFCVGLLIILALLVSCHLWFRMPALAILTVNTLILLFLGLPLADAAVRCVGRLRPHPETRKQYYLYDTAKRHPATFGRWWNYYLTQWRQAERQFYAPDPDPGLTFRLRPNSHALVDQSLYSINSRGFRGKEIPAEKGNAYRIVALGESTTFGITFNREDHPWPELLEQMIRERLKPRWPVEVINAGIPGYRLDMNLHRFPTEILPLKPDMVISYHGINSFGTLRDAVPFASGASLPAYKERPLRLLADSEYHLRLIRYHHLRPPKLLPRPTTTALTDLQATSYAQLYRRLIQMAATNHIRLVLATYSMAVNDRSDPALVEFYQGGYPLTPWQIQANLVHSTIVQKIAVEHPEVWFVDSHPQLDGEHDKFIDLVHFAPAGDQQLAENFFAALRPILEQDLMGQ